MSSWLVQDLVIQNIRFRTGRNDKITMNKTKVKICGIRNLEHADIAMKAGADFFGFNFVPTSKRYIEPKNAKEILNQLTKNYKLQNKIVGVFQDQSVEEVNSIADFLEIDYVQLHGNEDDEYMKEIKKNIIKSIFGRGRLYAYPKGNHEGYPYNNTKYYLLDRITQGEGEMVDMEKAKNLAESVPLFLAGGLTPENISSIVSAVKPFAVDVASGIETNGLIDNEKVKRFIENVKGGII